MAMMHSRELDLREELQRSLFRAVVGSDVLKAFGSTFRQETPVDDDVSFAVSEVDIFVSHSWSSDSWAKYFALCRELNLHKALESLSVLLVLFFPLFPLRGIDPKTGFDAETTLFVAVCWLSAMGVYLAVLFFGQHLHIGVSGPRNPTLWVDKLCIHQGDAGQKAAGIRALPFFVTQSSKFLMLYDGSYLDRLWCVVELATFVNSSSCEHVCFVPLWLPRWLFTTMLLDILQGCICIAALLASCAPSPQKLSPLASDRSLNHFLNNLLLVVVLLPGYIVVLVPSMWALGRKAQGHEEMLRQFAAFDIRNCKCSDESDRQPLQALVAGLFTEDDVASVSIEVAGSISDSSESTTSVSEEWHGSYRSLVRCGSLSADEGPDPGPLSQEPRKEGSGSDSGLEAFNAYVRGPLRQALMDKLGDETFLSFRTCFVAFLPGSSFFLLNTLAVDGAHSAAFDFPHSPEKWILCLVEAAIMNLTVTPLLLPNLLYLTHKVYISVRPGCLQSLLTLVGGFVVSTLVIFLGFAALGALEAVVLTHSFRFFPNQGSSELC
ncbi:PFOR [Symbiodinium sp. CCMP2592]|nr:PFOR [Symbiodinium sp. CCMP2592]